jgi:spore germination protein KC
MNKKLKTFITLFLIVTIGVFPLSGWYNEQNIDHLAFVVAIGFDIGTDNNLKLSFQISVPGSSEESSGSSQSDSSIVTTIECATFDSGVNLLNSYLSKESNLSHCKIIVFSEEFASSGLSDTLYTLMNKVEVRPDCSVLVSKCNAEYFLKNSEPVLEKLSARYYEIAPTSSEYTGYTQSITLNDFFSDYTDTFQTCYAILGGIGENNIENMGLAIFNDDKLIGELDGLETICHLMISSSLNSCVITIPSPFDTDKTISLKVRLVKDTKNKAHLVNGSAYITSKVKLEARVLTMNENSNYLDPDEITQLEESLNSYLTTQIYEYLYKISKEFKSDIDGFGKYVVQNFKTYDEWENFNWLDNFKNSFFNVTVDTTIKSSYVLVKS